jgi:rhodanese-related sulfurtransferase
MKAGRIAGKTWRAVWQSGAIVVLACATGLLANEYRSDKLPLVADWSLEDRLTTDAGNGLAVSLDEARRLCLNGGAVFLDARSPEDYARGHIRCAQNVPWQSFDEYMDRVWGVIPEDVWIVTYCDGETCSLGEDLAKGLLAIGYQKVKVFPNGYTRWVEARVPTDRVQHAFLNKERTS